LKVEQVKALSSNSNPAKKRKKKALTFQAWWYMPVIPAHGRLRHKDLSLRPA
jgi:hypothetical protein